MVDGAADESISVVITGPGSHRVCAEAEVDSCAAERPKRQNASMRCIDDADSVGAR